MMQQAPQWLMFAFMVPIFLLVVGWLLTHTVGLIVYLRRHAREAEKLPPLAIATWVTSFAGGFFGPLVILAALVSSVMAVVLLLRIRSGACGSRARLPAVVTLLAGVLIFLVTGLAVVMALVASPS